MDNPRAAAIAEAAVWMARLRADERQPDMVNELRAWLNRSDEHRAAFEAVSDTWEISAGLESARVRPVGQTHVGSWRMAAIAACVVLLGLFGAWHLNSRSILATDVGELRSATLADGSTLTLNTQTRVRLRFSDEERVVLLDEGEASFRVAHDPRRPFMVKAGNATVVALGTDFDVRWVEDSFDATLAEGRVRVRVLDQGGAPREVELRPGQRLSADRGSIAVEDAVNLRNLRSWRSGQVVFDNTPLQDAVAEMNRYNRSKIRLSGLDAGRVKISGAFRAGGSAEFARALRDLYGFELRQDDDDFVIAPADG